MFQETLFRAENSSSISRSSSADSIFLYFILVNISAYYFASMIFLWAVVSENFSYTVLSEDCDDLGRKFDLLKCC